MEKYENVFRVLGIGMVVPIVLLNLFGETIGLPDSVRLTIVLILLLIQIISIVCSLTIFKRRMKQMKEKHDEFMKKFDETIEKQSKYN